MAVLGINLLNRLVLILIIMVVIVMVIASAIPAINMDATKIYRQ